MIPILFDTSARARARSVVWLRTTALGRVTRETASSVFQSQPTQVNGCSARWRLATFQIQTNGIQMSHLAPTWRMQRRNGFGGRDATATVLSSSKTFQRGDALSLRKNTRSTTLVRKLICVGTHGRSVRKEIR